MREMLVALTLPPVSVVAVHLNGGVVGGGSTSTRPQVWLTRSS